MVIRRNPIEDAPKLCFKRKKFATSITIFVIASFVGNISGVERSNAALSKPVSYSFDKGSNFPARKSAPTDSSGARVYPASIDGYAVIDPATIAVRFTVRNNGNTAVSPTCTISLQNAGGTYHGFEIFSMTSISAGTTRHATGKIVITSQGASYVTQSKISCTAKTSDNAVSSGKTVKVISVTDALGAYDQSTGWYWGGIIKVSGVGANTQLKCTEIARNASKKVIATHSFEAVTFNDGTLTGYGQGQDPTVDATKSIAHTLNRLSN